MLSGGSGQSPSGTKKALTEWTGLRLYILEGKTPSLEPIYHKKWKSK